MNFEEDIKTITDMKTKPAELLKRLKKNRRPILITQNGEPQAVLQNIAEYQKQKDLFLLLRLIAIGEQEIKQGKTTNQGEVFARLDKKYLVIDK